MKINFNKIKEIIILYFKVFNIFIFLSKISLSSIKFKVFLIKNKYFILLFNILLKDLYLYKSFPLITFTFII